MGGSVFPSQTVLGRLKRFMYLGKQASWARHHTLVNQNSAGAHRPACEWTKKGAWNLA